jgi:hypothetical protein
VGLTLEQCGETLLMLASRIDQGQFNHLSGLGLSSSPSDIAAMETAMARFHAAGLKNPFVQIPPGQEALEAHARGLGLTPYKRPWVKFHRAPENPPAVETDLVAERVDLSNAETFGQVVIAAFGMPAILTGWIAGLVGRPGWQCFLAYDGPRAVAGAALYVRGRTAWFGIGATLPDARRRGAQSALLARRIAAAGEAGATDLTVETGLPLPGEAGPSFANILRAGFLPAYERANWTLPA